MASGPPPGLGLRLASSPGCHICKLCARHPKQQCEYTFVSAINAFVIRLIVIRKKAAVAAFDAIGIWVGNQDIGVERSNRFFKSFVVHEVKRRTSDSCELAAFFYETAQ